MGLNAVKVLGISITSDSKEKILEYIQKYLDPKHKIQNSTTKKIGKPLIIVTPNPEQIVYAGGDKHFRDILNRADIAIPDGIGVVWASRILKKNRTEVIEKRIPGVETAEDLAKIASEEGATIGLIGGRAKVAVEALECLRRKYPGLHGWAVDPGDLSLRNLGNVADISEKIAKTKTRIVFVGLGAPKQEFFIEKLLSSIEHRASSIGGHAPKPETRNPKLILMAVGGSFDTIAGRIRRAPLIIRLIGFEWAWRLINEPWRWRRQLTLIKFMVLVLKEKILSL